MSAPRHTLPPPEAHTRPDELELPRRPLLGALLLGALLILQFVFPAFSRIAPPSTTASTTRVVARFTPTSHIAPSTQKKLHFRLKV